MVRNGKEADVKKYRVTLEAQERHDLEKLVSRGKALARRLTHARILLLADESPGAPARAAQKDQEIANALGINVRTIERVRERFVERGLAEALDPLPSKRVYERKLDGKGEAQLIALACSSPPEGRERWTLRLLADAMVELEHVDSISHETVGQVLKKKRGQAVAQEDVVHPAGARLRVRSSDGRRAGGLPPSLR